MSYKFGISWYYFPIYSLSLRFLQPAGHVYLSGAFGHFHYVASRTAPRECSYQGESSALVFLSCCNYCMYDSLTSCMLCAFTYVPIAFPWLVVITYSQSYTYSNISKHIIDCYRWTCCLCMVPCHSNWTFSLSVWIWHLFSGMTFFFKSESYHWTCLIVQWSLYRLLIHVRLFTVSSLILF